ncbi:MAG TPA: hypothetical protein V6C89_15030 [Drouetiella sp.]
MNKAFVSLVVLGAVAISAPAFAKAPSAVPAKGAKIVASKTTSKVQAPQKNKVAKNTIKKAK